MNPFAPLVDLLLLSARIPALAPEIDEATCFKKTY